jgi:glycosyltransferase involved in cell wall biosynthesis|tara:strand:+ start:12229 stop:12957 length:729 start_codon:yes stop_codon:yes gene_type:complete
MNKVYFITPTYNASYHLEDLYESLLEQTNENWKWFILNDMSNDDTLEIAQKIENKDKLKRVSVIAWSEKKFALKGICDCLSTFKETEYPDDSIIAIVDGDDALCNENTVNLILSEYEKNPNLDSLWTAHSWDINGMNISKELPDNINPYQYPWVSSHLKTFKLGVFKKIKNKNFQDLDGNWFERGYDQALYLPILHLSKERKFLNEICYLYRINSNSLKIRQWKEKSQMDTIRLVRSRGLIA